VRTFRRGSPPMPVPEDFLIPTCKGCGEIYFSAEESDQLGEHLRKSFLVWQSKHLRSLVGALMSTHGIRQVRVAGLCHTKPDQLTRFLDGVDLVDPLLQMLLEALVHSPEEAGRQIRGELFSDSP
jgi:hypothetical protein